MIMNIIFFTVITLINVLITTYGHYGSRGLSINQKGHSCNNNNNKQFLYSANYI